MKKGILLVFLMTLCVQVSDAQRKNAAPAEPVPGYSFTPVVDLKTTPVKNQSATGTCWCFATTSFIESELLRMGKGEYDLSEMYIVKYNYIDKLKDNYLRRGKGNIEEGGLSHDWMRVFKEKGIVPDEIYPGLEYGSETHNHSELQDFLKAVAEVPIKRRRESPEYINILNSLLNTYLGESPATFTYKGTSYTPQSFAASLSIDPSDYVEITSFSHFPFYSRGILEIPDNWTMDLFYNVPINELIEIMDHALNNGYTVNWDGDVSEPGFSHNNGYAVIPSNLGNERGAITDRARLEGSNSRSGTGNTGSTSTAIPGPEINVTQDMRQYGYEDFTTTDDHLMHITGMVRDQNGTKYYKTKNSWGTDRSPFGGYLNMSESYVRAKTLFIMVHKDAIPPAIRSKLGL